MRKTGKNELIALLAVAGVITAGAAQAANPSHDASARSNALKVVDQSRTNLVDGRDGSCAPGKCGAAMEEAEKKHEKKVEKKVEEKKAEKKAAPAKKEAPGQKKPK